MIRSQQRGMYIRYALLFIVYATMHWGFHFSSQDINDVFLSILLVDWMYRGDQKKLDK